MRQQLGVAPASAYDDVRLQDLQAVPTYSPTQAANASVDGAVLLDPTPASAGNQQFSPRLRLRGQGWKTTSVAGSQPIDWIVEAQPVQGTTAPTSILAFSSQANNGGYTTAATLTGTGAFSCGAISCTSINSSSGSAFFGGSISAGSGGSLGSGNGRLVSSGSGSWTLGLGNAAAPVSYTLQGQGSRGGTDSNVAGANITLASGLGTGNAAGATLTLSTAHATASGTGAQTLVSGLVLGDTSASFPNDSLVVGAPTGGAPAVGSINAQGLQINGAALNANLSGTSGSIGGGALLAGAAATGTVSIPGATTAMAVCVTPVTYPGAGFIWDGYVSAAGTVTVVVQATIAGTPTASVYNVRLIP
jgi:hypothetical protein